MAALCMVYMAVYVLLWQLVAAKLAFKLAAKLARILAKILAKILELSLGDYVALRLEPAVLFPPYYRYNPAYIIV